MTAEERALKVLGEIEAYTVDDLSWPQWADLIAQALRDHENAAYERAALFCDGEAKTPAEAGEKAAGRREAGRRLGRVLRSLISKKD